MNEAQQRAEDMLSQAQQQTAQILDQNEIVQTAYQRAEDIMRQEMCIRDSVRAGQDIRGSKERNQTGYRGRKLCKSRDGT